MCTCDALENYIRESEEASGKPHNFRMLLELPEDLFAQGIDDLGVDAGVLDVFVAQVVGHVLDAAAGFQEMHGHGVAQRVHRALLVPAALV
jgi:hypothetical protein